jgi:hypothetical protein
MQEFLFLPPRLTGFLPFEIVGFYGETAERRGRIQDFFQKRERL